MLDPALEVLQQRGLAHEESYVKSLRAQGLSTVKLDNEDSSVSAYYQTCNAMRRGSDVIIQATLAAKSRCTSTAPVHHF